MDQPPGRTRAEDGVPGGGLTGRKLLRAVPRLVWGEAIDITLCGSLAAALQARDEQRDLLYERAAAGSGIAFGLRVDERWDPDTASAHDAVVVARAARALGLRADVVEPPFDDELRELAWERVVESIEAELPPLARGLLGLAEFGVVSGYDAEGRVLFARTYADRAAEPSRLAFADAVGGSAPATFVFFDRADTPDEARLARDALGMALQASASATHDTDGARLHSGEAAFASWIAGLVADVPPREAAARAFVDHARRVFLHDARRTAARYLRRVRRHFPDRVGAELIRAAESYGYVADECAKVGVQPFEASIVARFMDPGLRRGWAHGLERASEREREAIAALRVAAVALA